MMKKLKKKISVLLYKMEKIFPHVFFNLMQDILIHLPYETKVDDPV
jgi:hypothetical protein